MKELTFAEVKQGLICCTVNRNCASCPLYIDGDINSASAGDLTCTGILMSAARACLNNFAQDLATAYKRVAEWEAVATAHEKSLIELRESLDRRGKNNG